MNGFADMLVGFAVNLIAVAFVIRFMYYPANRDKSYVLTFFALSTALYFVLRILMEHGNFSVEVGFGLFAVFSVLRFRSDPIPMRELGYLFVIIAFPIVNAILGAQDTVAQLLFADLIIVASLFAIEQGWGFEYETRQVINYERIELIKPENRRLLLQDLLDRTGLIVNRVEIRRIDLLRDTAELVVYYDAHPQRNMRQLEATEMPAELDYSEMHSIR